MASVSVIIPAYNAEATLVRCAESILSQKGVDLELVIVDDGSTDDTPALADAIATADGRARVIHQQNGGRSRARNAGIDTARGEWVAFCDADDWMYPGSLARMAALAEGETCAVWAGYTMDSAETIGAPDGELTCRLAPHTLVRKILHPAELVVRSGGIAVDADGTWERSACAKLYSRAQLISSGARFPEGLRYGEDALFNVEFLARAEGAVVVDGRLAYFYDQSPEGTCMNFTEADAESLVPFCQAASKALAPIVARKELGFNELDAADFIGREMTGVMRRAALYGPRPAEAGAWLESAIQAPEVRGAWTRATLAGRRQRAIRRVLLALFDSGHGGAAIGLYRAALRVKGIAQHAKRDPSGQAAKEKSCE